MLINNQNGWIKLSIATIATIQKYKLKVIEIIPKIKTNKKVRL